MATVIILFTYLPAALVVFKPGYTKQSKKQREKGGSDVAEMVTRFWNRIGDVVIRNYTIFAVTGVAVIAFGFWGVYSKIETQVHLLKMFDPSAKVLADYRWLEENLGELVPAEIVVSIERADQQEVYLETLQERQRLALEAERLKKEEAGELKAADEAPAIVSTEQPGGDNKVGEDTDEPPPFIMSPSQKRKYALRLSMLERVELSSRVRELLQLYFGDNGLGIVGSGMSTDVLSLIHISEPTRPY